MGFKLVRDRQPDWCRENGVSGQWRTSRNPIASCARKIAEEYGEWVGEQGEDSPLRGADELYDLRDVLDRLIELADPAGVAAEAHRAKVAALGEFEFLIEWSPVPAGHTPAV
jgi:hypothetical protein